MLTIRTNPSSWHAAGESGCMQAQSQASMQPLYTVSQPALLHIFFAFELLHIVGLLRSDGTLLKIWGEFGVEGARPRT